MEVTEEQAKQIKEAAPEPLQRAAAGMKRDFAEMVLGWERRGFGEKRVENPTEGQKLMAKMLVKEAAGGKMEPRPAGYAIAFTPGSDIGGISGEKFFNQGRILFTSPLETTDGGYQMIGADKEGVFVVKGGEGESGLDFLAKMRPLLELVGDQEQSFFIKHGEGVNPFTNFEVSRLQNDVSAAEMIKKASEASLKAPLILSLIHI